MGEDNKYKNILNREKKSIDKKVNKMEKRKNSAEDVFRAAYRDKGLSYWEINLVINELDFKPLLEHGIIDEDKYKEMCIERDKLASEGKIILPKK